MTPEQEVEEALDTVWHLCLAGLRRTSATPSCVRNVLTPFDLREGKDLCQVCWRWWAPEIDAQLPLFFK